MKQVIEAHVQEYERRPDLVARAPGTFHLIGEHSWFCKDKTMSMAVDLSVYVAVSARDDSFVRFHFVQTRERKRYALSMMKLRKEDRWSNLLKAVIHGFTSGGFDVGGMDVTVWSDIPSASGLGIATAVKVGAAYAIRELFSVDCPDSQLVQVVDRGNKLFLRAERPLADVYAAMFSRDGCCVVTDYALSACDSIPFPFDDVAVILTDTKVPSLSWWNVSSIAGPENVLLLGELKERRAGAYGGLVYEESPAEISEVLSVVSEDTRRRLRGVMLEHKYVQSAVSAMRDGSLADFCRAVSRSHDTVRDLFLLSCPEVDWLVRRVQDFDTTTVRNPNGCSRVSGRGVGRCTYTVLRNPDVDLYKKRLAEYERIFGFHPLCREVRPSGGVHLCDFC